ncbi:MAG: hypothetical protein WA324_03510 [Bryobacteraceae bacterium]
MDIKRLIALPLLGCTAICCGLAAVRDTAEFAAAQTDSGVGPLSRSTVDIDIKQMTTIEALLEIGRKSGNCLGAVLFSRSIASAEISPIRASNISVGALLQRLLGADKGWAIIERNNCIVLQPSGEKPGFLAARIPSFQMPSQPLEVASSALDTALLATQGKPQSHSGVWGTASSISAETASPIVGPLRLKSESVETILSILASTAKSTMWLAYPAETKQPWTFIRYGESRDVIRHKLAAILTILPE